jgi:exosortase/archaeosortase family protein
MTSSLVEFPAGRGPLTTLYTLPRNEFFAGLYVLGCANGVADGVLQAFKAGDWTGGVLNVSVIVWFACFAGVALLLRDKTEAVRPADFAVAGVFLLLVTLPIAPASWAAVAGLSLYVLASAEKGSARRRGAMIMLTVTVPMLWSKMLFHFFANPILETDAAMVSWLLGTDRVGNMVRFADNSGYMVVFPDCSSLKNVSMAFLCWAAITQWVEHKWSRWDALYCLSACIAVVVVNVSRISLMGISHANYFAIHNQTGDDVANTIILVFTVGFSLLGVRRELFSRA